MSALNDLAGNPRNMADFMTMFSELAGKKYQRSGQEAFQNQQKQQQEEMRRQKIQKRIVEIQKLLASPNVSMEQKAALNQELSELQQELGIQVPYGDTRRTGGGGDQGGLGSPWSP